MEDAWVINRSVKDAWVINRSMDWVINGSVDGASVIGGNVVVVRMGCSVAKQCADDVWTDSETTGGGAGKASTDVPTPSCTSQWLDKGSVDDD